MGAWAFHGWVAKRGMPPEVEVMPVELPGRNTRAEEETIDTMEELIPTLVDALRPYIENTSVPYALFGHSFGAWVVYEFAHECLRQNLPLPCKLYVSANRTPAQHGVANDVDPTEFSELDFDDFRDAFELRDGKIKDLESLTARRFVFPTLVGDFNVIDKYVPKSLDPLPIPIEAMGAHSDNRYTKEQISAWSERTSAGFTETWFEGNHRYVVDNPDPLVKRIGEDLVTFAPPPSSV